MMWWDDKLIEALEDMIIKMTAGGELAKKLQEAEDELWVGNRIQDKNCRIYKKCIKCPPAKHKPLGTCRVWQTRLCHLPSRG